MILRITAILFPIFAIVALGYWYGRRHDPEMAVANRLNMDIFVPALVFAALAGKSFDLLSYQALAVGGIAVVLGSGLLAWPLARLLKVDSKTCPSPPALSSCSPAAACWRGRRRACSGCRGRPSYHR